MNEHGASILRLSWYPGLRSSSSSNVAMPNPQPPPPLWKVLQQGKPKIEPNEINDLLIANVGHPCLSVCLMRCDLGCHAVCTPLVSRYLFHDGEIAWGMGFSHMKYHFVVAPLFLGTVLASWSSSSFSAIHTITLNGSRVLA